MEGNWYWYIYSHTWPGPGKTGYIHAETYLRAQPQCRGQRDPRPQSCGVGHVGRVGRSERGARVHLTVPINIYR